MLELIELIMPFFSGLLLVIFVMIGVAFLTLLERKLLGYIQIRKGPNKVGFLGIPQPFSDAIKLFTKEQTFPMMSNFLIYYFSPIFSLFLSLSVWVCMPYFMKIFSFNLGVLFFICCLSMGVYGVMIAGWSSNSNYALLGGLRAVAQTISYEVSLVLILLSTIFLILSYNFFSFSYLQEYCWFIVYLFPLGLVWFSSSLAETNRTPFDFAEGESELVSGFNVEYSSGGFALIFLAEYASILFMSMLFSLIFLGGNLLSFFFYLKLLFISFLFIWVRGTLPRFRYDKLMNLSWKMYLPFSLNMLIFVLSLKIFLF
uniref:NADH-ubiquinone oxidoreductase chain 1 n=1 Tax=Thienemanniella tusimufegea TaxID=3072307 RepID=A0AA51QUF6_9DIPT|nr:NADH dehydrogenase subunit 1 [Thienemanniella tusimufegea]WML69368.1 NADH dehydrogenase subunit 1 [Thienemanniella tusimufegea]